LVGFRDAGAVRVDLAGDGRGGRWSRRFLSCGEGDKEEERQEAVHEVSIAGERGVEARMQRSDK
jgi:hypothetical protein